ncbi:hypothetical protein [Flavobacterium sp.]|uniref:hypothetical protein n=1 Tax=Flavobacterium sp. TaxID=239 RepID=UPI00286C62F9|nr:hypothetical protein [Flavobacterium sp.]
MKTLKLLWCLGKPTMPLFKVKFSGTTTWIIVCLLLLKLTSADAMWKSKPHYESRNTSLLLSTVTVGTGGNYATLKAAFDAINAGTITGLVTLQIISSTTETAMASLNASGTGLANYSSVLIYTTGTGYSISGAISNPLINLNGADNVVIDGRVNATGATANLVITNSDTGINACALRLTNSAENNIIKYATLAASGLSLGTAIVTFSTSASGNGNDTNVVEFCNLTNAGGNRPFNAILSTGSAGRENSGNSIRNNTLFNFINNNNNSFGVNISIYSSDWNINNNSFYETSALAPTGNYTYGAIRIATPNMHTVSGNYIGGSQPFCGGTPFTMISSFDTYFSGIFVTGNNTTPPLVQNNTIQNFNYSSTSTNPWDGLYLSSGSVSFIGNTIGASTGTNSIVVTTPNATATATISGGVVTAINLVGGGSGFLTAPLITFTLSGSTTQATATATISGGVVTGFTITNGGSGYTSTPNVNVNGAGYSTTHGIRCLNSGTVTIENNSIGSVTTFGNVAYSHCFEGIVISGFPTSVITVNNNLIGSLSTANSIKTSSPATSSIFKQDVRGIYINSAVNLVTASGNTIANMTNSYTGSSTSKVDGICSNADNNVIQNNTIRDITACMNSITVRGIQQFVTTTGTNQTITGNTVYNLSNTHPTASLVVIGIDYTGPTSGTNVVSGNFIYGLSATSSNVLCEIDGILIGNGATTVANNIINLGTSVTTGYKIYGINDNSSASATNNNSIYFNSVYLAGTVSSTVTSATAALWNANNIALRNYRNNILMNVRTGGTTGKHYAIKIAGLSGLTIDYNDYYCNAGTFSGYSGTDKTTLATWKTATGQDTNSLNTNPLFTSAGGTNPLNYYTSAILNAATGTGIASDYTGLARSVAPKMGALEITAYVWSGAVSTDFANAANWQNGLVPTNGSDISFAVSPTRNCVLDQNRSLRNITNAQATYQLLLNGKQLTLTGNLTFSNSAKIDATATSSSIQFSGTAAQSIPSGALVSNTMDGLTLNNIAGLTINDNITIAHPLTLTTGALTIGARTLTLSGTITTTTGTMVGGSSSNIVIGGSGVFGLPAISLNNLTVNRATGISLTGSVSVAGTLALTAGTISVGANTLTLSGNSPTRVSGAVDVSNTAATLAFTNTVAITLPIAFFAGNVNNLTIDGLGGITSADDFTINGVLHLVGNNPSATKGALDMLNGATIKTLTMTSNATSIGIGDTTGIIKRTTITDAVSYTFGNEFMKVYFSNIGTLPSQVSLKVSIGTAPSWKTGAINREIEVIQTGAVGTSCVVSYHYLDSELNGNNEDHLVLWVKIGNFEYGSSAFNTTENWVALSNVNIAFFNAAFDGTRNVTLAEYSTTNTITWNGSLSTSWTSVQNWTPNVGPSATKNIIIPNTTTTPNAPTLPSVTDINSLTIEAGGILNAVTSAQLTIEGTNAWSNYGGTFNPNTSNVIINNATATISGTTNFYDVTINSGKKLSMTQDSTMRIAGTITNNGIWKTIVSGPTTVEYNGAAQTVINPNGTTAGYSNLILSGSATKTMVSALVNIYGNFSLADTVTATAASALTIAGNVAIGQNATFNTGNFDHTIAGNFDDSGTFNAASGHTISLNGTSPQSILGTSVTVFSQLTINNNSGVTVDEPTNVNTLLTLTNGVFKIDNTLGILGTITKTFGSLETTPASSLNIGGSGAMVFASDLFSAQPSLNNLTINRSGGLTLGQSMTVNGALNMTSGNLTIGNNNLTIEALGTITIVSPSPTKMIIASGTGEVRKMMITGSSFTYPIGDNTGTPEYSPITITLADDGAANNYYGVKVTNAKHPNNASTTDYLNRYWSLTRSGNNPHIANIAATCTSSDIVGTQTSISGACITGNFDQLNNPWIKYNALSGNTITMTNIPIAASQTTVFSGIKGANPTVTMLGATSTCSGSDVALGTTVTAEGTVLYNWTPSDFLSSTTIANPIATAITATTAYTVTIKDGNGISANATGTVTAGNTTTYNGTWDNGVPTAISTVVIAANYTAAASLACCSLTVNNNAVVNIPSGMNVTLNGALTVSSGSFTLENNANLLQNTNAANSGNIIVKRSSSALIRQDYTLWSSPVSGQQLLAFSPATLPTRFYQYDSPTNVYAALTPTVNFENAKGYLIRVPNTHPATATVWNGSFSGVPHNGNYSYTMNVGDATHRFNLVGNPYPSPISMAQFVTENSNSITGTLYFWRKTNNAASPSYCSWVGGTFVNNGEAQVFDPSGIIRTGQGFFVEAKAAASSVLFANTQRVSNIANQFFRTTDTEEQHRIWLNATDTSGAFSQTEVGYVTNAVTERDAYDGQFMNDGAIALYSLIDAQPLVIQGRALPFDATDMVPLGFKATTAGTYTIAIDHVDGLFSGTQTIYLKDHLMGTEHDLKANAYTFASESGTFDNRFEIVYTDLLSTPTVTASSNPVIVYKNNDALMIDSGIALMTSVQIFDSRGRLLAEKKELNKPTTSFQNLGANGVLFVRISSATGVVVVKKVLW